MQYRAAGEMGGKFENQYVLLCSETWLCLNWHRRCGGGDAQIFTREYNGQVFQDILLTDMYKLN